MKKFVSLLSVLAILGVIIITALVSSANTQEEISAKLQLTVEKIAMHNKEFKENNLEMFKNDFIDSNIYPDETMLKMKGYLFLEMLETKVGAIENELSTDGLELKEKTKILNDFLVEYLSSEKYSLYYTDDIKDNLISTVMEIQIGFLDELIESDSISAQEKIQEIKQFMKNYIGNEIYVEYIPDGYEETLKLKLEENEKILLQLLVDNAVDDLYEILDSEDEVFEVKVEAIEAFIVDYVENSKFAEFVSEETKTDLNEKLEEYKLLIIKAKVEAAIEEVKEKVDSEELNLEEKIEAIEVFMEEFANNEEYSEFVTDEVKNELTEKLNEFKAELITNLIENEIEALYMVLNSDTSVEYKIEAINKFKIDYIENEEYSSYVPEDIKLDLESKLNEYGEVIIQKLVEDEIKSIQGVIYSSDILPEEKVEAIVTFMNDFVESEIYAKYIPAEVIDELSEKLVEYQELIDKTFVENALEELYKTLESEDVTPQEKIEAIKVFMLEYVDNEQYGKYVSSEKVEELTAKIDEYEELILQLTVEHELDLLYQTINSEEIVPEAKIISIKKFFKDYVESDVYSKFVSEDVKEDLEKKLVELDEVIIGAFVQSKINELNDKLDLAEATPEEKIEAINTFKTEVIGNPKYSKHVPEGYEEELDAKIKEYEEMITKAFVENETAKLLKLLEDETVSPEEKLEAIMVFTKDFIKNEKYGKYISDETKDIIRKAYVENAYIKTKDFVEKAENSQAEKIEAIKAFIKEYIENEKVSEYLTNTQKNYMFKALVDLESEVLQVKLGLEEVSVSEKLKSIYGFRKTYIYDTTYSKFVSEEFITYLNEQSVSYITIRVRIYDRYNRSKLALVRYYNTEPDTKYRLKMFRVYKDNIVQIHDKYTYNLSNGLIVTKMTRGDYLVKMIDEKTKKVVKEKEFTIKKD